MLLIMTKNNEFGQKLGNLKQFKQKKKETPTDFDWWVYFLMTSLKLM